MASFSMVFATLYRHRHHSHLLAIWNPNLTEGDEANEGRARCFVSFVCFC